MVGEGKVDVGQRGERPRGLSPWKICRGWGQGDKIHVKIHIYVHFICTKYTWDLIKKMYIHYLSFHEENFIKGTK